MIPHNVHRERNTLNTIADDSCAISGLLIGARLASTRREDDTDNETIQSKSFCEDKNQNHAHKQLWLLCVRPGEEINQNKM